MAIRHEDFTPEQHHRQAALNRSWEAAQQDLADPSFKAYLQHSIEHLDAKPLTPTMTAEEFLAQTETPTE